MASLDLFTAKDYRVFLSAWLEQQPQPHGLLSKMATAIHCQNSHLSRVLQEKVHLSMDQSFRLTSFMKLTEAESAYFLKLVEHDRAGDANYRKKLKKEMMQIQRQQENLAHRFQADRLGEIERETIYYSSWHWSALHILSYVPNFQSLEKMSQRLGLSESYVLKSLEELERLGLVEKVGTKWKNKSTGVMHLPKSSPMNSIQHGHWRQRAVLKSQNQDEDSLHFTAIQAISEADFEKLKLLFLETLDHYRSIANPSPEEEVICFNLDFFRI